MPTKISAADASYFLGFDGGGTKTDCVLADREGRVVARASEADVATLRERVSGLVAAAGARDREVYFRIKRSLHEALVGAAYNPTLTSTA